ncbi:MAG: hypothetical protein JNL98_29210 [Bryobacterales bacterium]|nr:hypothetical protein [Bryobacterales bacterium]
MATRDELTEQLHKVEAEIAATQAKLDKDPPIATRNALEAKMSMLQARASSLRQQIAAMGPKSFAMADDELPSSVAEAPPVRAAPTTAAKKVAKRPAKKAVKKAARKALKKSSSKGARKAAKKVMAKRR